MSHAARGKELPIVLVKVGNEVVEGQVRIRARLSRLLELLQYLL